MPESDREHRAYTNRTTLQRDGKATKPSEETHGMGRPGI
jgi:hypothetical protein